MNIKNAKHPTVVKAGIAGLLFTLAYAGIEFRRGFPERIALGGDANSLNVFHHPVIWLLASVMFYGMFYAIKTIRDGKVKERPVTFGLNIATAVLIALYWALPMTAGLYSNFIEPTITSNETNLCTSVTESPIAGLVTIHYSGDVFCPVEVIIRKGNTVRFVADEGILMRITSDYPSFNQKESASEYSVTFTEVGTYSYYDNPSATTNPFWKFISELGGKTQTLQGTIKVTE